jgi:hypothetical protein
MNPPPLLHGHARTLRRAADLYLPLIRRIYHKSERPRPGSLGLGMTKRKPTERHEPVFGNLPETNLPEQSKDR